MDIANSTYITYGTYITTILLWMGLAYFLYDDKSNNIKITRNYISTIHATFVLLFFSFSVPTSCLFYVSTGYYTFDGIMDLYYLIKTRRFYNMTIIVHHIVSCLILCYLRDSVVSKYIYYSFFLTETSNFPIYLVYHLNQKKYDNKFVIKSFIVIEALSFLILRLVLCGRNLYSAYISNEVPYLPIVCGGIIYVMSIIWLYGMVLQIFRKSNKEKTN